MAFSRIIGIDSPGCQVGFPEINLGLLPGYGGSARAYSRLGLEGALQLVLQGKSLKARDAHALGVMDYLVGDASELASAAQDVMAGKIERKPARTADEPAAVIAEARAAVAKRALPETMPAPFAILDHYSGESLDQTILQERETPLFSELMMTPASAGLRRTFQLNDAVKKGARGEGAVSHIHVIGAGVMGGDIAAVAAMSGFDVTLQDLSEEAITGAMARARTLYERRLKDPAKVGAVLARLSADPKGDGLATADLMIEAVAENLDIKRRVFADAEVRMKPDAIMATNTSAIPLEEIGTALAAPDRLIGMHFFNPVPVLPLVGLLLGLGAMGRTSADGPMRGRPLAITAVILGLLMTVGAGALILERLGELSAAWVLFFISRELVVEVGPCAGVRAGAGAGAGAGSTSSSSLPSSSSLSSSSSSSSESSSSVSHSSPSLLSSSKSSSSSLSSSPPPPTTKSSKTSTASWYSAAGIPRSSSFNLAFSFASCTSSRELA